MIKKLHYFLGILLLFSASSCRTLYPNEMFKQKDYQFFELAKKKVEEYVIQPGDEMTLEVFSRDGFKLVDVLGGGFGGNPSGGMNTSALSTGTTTTSSGTTTTTMKHTYLVDKEGFAKLPVLGMFYVKGYTQNELETQLAQRYASLFVNPFVILRVSNRRVFVFRGETASVVELNNAPTSLPEVLAKAGGLNRSLKSYNIKIIRGDLSNPQVRIINLSTLEGLRTADLTVQSNDIIYVEQKKTVVTDALVLLAPIVSTITSAITIIVFARSLK
jgi:polysaccharide export outer membrane protein